MNSFSWPLLRDAGRLHFLQNQPGPAVGRRLHCRGADTAWRLNHIPLERVPETVAHSSLRSIRLAWSRLGCASYDAETLAALLLVLCASGSTVARCVMPLPLPRLRRTDVRPWLGDAAAVADLLRALASFATPALRLLATHAWLPLDAIGGLIPDWSHLDLFVLARCGRPVSVHDTGEMAPLAREFLALAPAGRPWTEAIVAEQAVRGLHLGDAEDAMGLAARVWTLSGSAWLREIAALERGDHIPVLRLLVTTHAATQAPPRDVRRVFATLDHAGGRERRQTDLRWIVAGLQRGASPGHLASALRFAKARLKGEVRGLCEAPKARHTLSSHLFVWLGEATCKSCAQQAWQDSAEAPEMQAAIAQMKSVALPSWAMHDLLRCLSRLFKSPASGRDLAVADSHRLAATLIARVRKLGHKRGAWWITALEYFFMSETTLAAAGFDHAIQLTDRIYRLANADADNVCVVLSAMMEVRGGAMLQLASGLDDHWFRRIAEAGGTWARRDRACEGILKLSSHDLDLLWPACRFLPMQWFNLMQEIACVPKVRLKPLFASAGEHPLFACRLRVDEPRLALIMIDAVRAERCKTNPVTARLREHAAGKRTLPTHLLEHDLALLYRGWLEAQVHLINELVQREIWLAFPGLTHDSGITTHSLKLALTIDDNKRPLRRLLRECARGNSRWIEHHPLNQEWRLRLGETCAIRWQEGIAAARVLPNFGEVIISPEDDPQEVLRMGSAVGSCLSLGGSNSFSAAANALDANKRVIYARTRDGKIVGRQLLAISEENRLVCFSPYPTKLKGPLVDFFADYDDVLAGHLCLPLCRNWDYTIKPLVAKEWYDDGLWSRMASGG